MRRSGVIMFVYSIRLVDASNWKSIGLCHLGLSYLYQTTRRDSKSKYSETYSLTDRPLSSLLSMNLISCSWRYARQPRGARHIHASFHVCTVSSLRKQFCTKWRSFLGHHTTPYVNCRICPFVSRLNTMCSKVLTQPSSHVWLSNPQLKIRVPMTAPTIRRAIFTSHLFVILSLLSLALISQ